MSKVVTCTYSQFFSDEKYLLDGGLATELERRGTDLKHPLWSAKILKESPELIFDAHYDFLCSGADIILTASYQASLKGFISYGLYEREARETIFSSLLLACYAREKYQTLNKNKKILIGGSLGPYGAYLADGSEYSAHYIDAVKADIHPQHKEALIDYYHSKIEILLAPRKNFKCDFLAFETLPSVVEARYIVGMMSKYPNAKYWLSFSDPQETLKAIESFSQLKSIIGFGVNCVQISRVMPSILDLAEKIKKNPQSSLIVYPNQGGHYDPAEKKWTPNISSSPKDWALALYNHGVKVVGGCCHVSTKDIQAISEALFCKP